MPNCNGFRIALVAAGLACAGPAYAAQRTFVASYGQDVWPCSVTQPCRGFATALGATDPGGEIVVLDSAGYGSVSIGKSVTIVAPPGVYAGISVFGGTGVSIFGAGIRVVLRGLTINGQGGLTGISIAGGADAVVEGCSVAGMLSSGISIVNPGTRATVRDTTVRRSAGAGIFSQGESTGVKEVQLERVWLEGNTNVGIFVGAGNRVFVSDSVVVNNNNGGITASGFPLNSIGGRLQVRRSLVAENSVGVFLLAQDDTGTSTVNGLVDESVIVGNSAFGVSVRTEPGSTWNMRGTLSGNLINGNGSQGVLGVRYGAGGYPEVILGGNVITGNGNRGIENVSDSATIRSVGSNRVRGNDVGNTSGTITTFPPI
jgi:hypothetical protein